MEAMGVAATQQGTVDREKVLPLPGWLVKVYFIFPVILYIPDAIFNYYVYSDGWNTDQASPLLQAGKVALVSFLSIGVVGMAYLLSVLAPWHWGQGHRIQAFFCALGVVIATAITTWNSLAYRSGSFVEFKTDQWAYNIWPQLAGEQSQHHDDSGLDCAAVLGSLLGDGAADDHRAAVSRSCRSRTPRR